MTSWDQVAKDFVQYYYHVFDTNRELGPLYSAQSMCTFEGQPFQGAEAIVQKIKSLPFQTVRHDVKTYDAQPAFADPLNPSSPMGVLVFVNGDVFIDGSTSPVKFAQVFHLKPHPQNPQSYYVYNDMFRLNYG
eukprot:TRINITY_DN6303_c0_g1::TRINITY_DN6303_c0_g1_i1::g.167::m.167 TRINITY_DN6303_c0_g1::TRINITY_DN6303_c0_g1_i1::g.167  ORF type:complete len:150 (+),score=1.48,sp/Q9C7F5/NTF2_ARATH/50.39/5e-35,NTF2/PF02136.15/6.8e-29 TRINITY_DN6303_c0_g1_i1:54-452(+)